MQSIKKGRRDWQAQLLPCVPETTTRELNGNQRSHGAVNGEGAGEVQCWWMGGNSKRHIESSNRVGGIYQKIGLLLMPLRKRLRITYRWALQALPNTAWYSLTAHSTASHLWAGEDETNKNRTITNARNMIRTRWLSDGSWGPGAEPPPSRRRRRCSVGRQARTEKASGRRRQSAGFAWPRSAGR